MGGEKRRRGVASRAKSLSKNVGSKQQSTQLEKGLDSISSWSTESLHPVAKKTSLKESLSRSKNDSTKTKLMDFDSFSFSKTETGRRLQNLLIETNALLEPELIHGESSTPFLGKKTNGFHNNDVKQAEIHRQTMELHELNKEVNLSKTQVEKLENEVRELQEQLNDFDFESQHTAGGHQFSIAASEEKDREYEKLVKEYVHTQQYIKTLHHMESRLYRSLKVRESRIARIRKEVESEKKEIRHRESELRELESNIKLNAKQFQKVEAECETELQEWKQKLETRKSFAEQTYEVLKFRKAQFNRKNAIAAEVQGDLDAEGEQKLQRQAVSNKIRQVKLAKDLEESSCLVDEYEVAFKRIISATGIGDINDIVEKYITQQETGTNLSAIIEEANLRIKNLEEERLNISKEMEEIRFSGLGHLNKHRKMVQNKEENLALSSRQISEIKEKSDFLRNIVYGIKFATQNLMMKLDQVNPKEGNPSNTISAANAGAQTIISQITGEDGDDVIEALKLCEQGLGKITSSLPSQIVNIADLDQVAVDKLTPRRVMVLSKPTGKNLISKPSETEQIQKEAGSTHGNTNRYQNIKGRKNGKRRKTTSKKMMAATTSKTYGKHKDFRKREYQAELSCESCSSSSESDSEGTREDDGESIAYHEGRHMLKTETGKLLSFAEKRKKRIQKMMKLPMSQQPPHIACLSKAKNKDAALAKYIENLTIKEAKRSSIWRSKRKKSGNKKETSNESDKGSVDDIPDFNPIIQALSTEDEQIETLTKPPIPRKRR